MQFEIYRFQCNYPGFLTKEGVLLQSPEGYWSEVSPFPGKNKESLHEAVEQLKAIQQGWKGPLFPSVEFGLYSLKRTESFSVPICLLLMGSVSQIVKQAEAPGYTTAKVKLGDFDVPTARKLTEELKVKFRLRIDLQEKWSPQQTRQFCSYFTPTDFEFIEDPGCDISPYPMKTETTTVWKPMVRGIPPQGADVILSSTFESGVGICQIATLAKRQEIPLHALGLGTYNFLENDLLDSPLALENGYLKIPSILLVNVKQLNLLSSVVFHPIF
jgi:O-succinylbenzoate synthase